MTAPKIATCCYCGTRASLVLTGKTRHELACSNCGAPLHDLKMLRTDHDGQRELVKPSPIRQKRPDRQKVDPVERRRKGKRRKGFFRRAFEEVLDEAWDMVEDIFD